jgi:hypothetical protein
MHQKLKKKIMLIVVIDPSKEVRPVRIDDNDRRLPLHKSGKTPDIGKLAFPG